MSNVIGLFSYGFMVNALVVGLLIALCAALIGVPLVLRKNSMIGDGLSHVAFGAFAIATALGIAPLWLALPVVLIASLFILRLNEQRKIHGDAAIALISTSALAIGTFVVSLTGTNTDINSYLFGSILSITTPEVIIAILLSIATIAIFALSYRQIFAITFDETFARSIGINTKRYNLVFAILCSVVIILGMRLMGALLISSLIIFPVLTARQIADNYRSVVISSAIISMLGFLAGLILSCIINTPTGATIVLANLVLFIFASLISRLIKQ